LGYRMIIVKDGLCS